MKGERGVRFDKNRVSLENVSMGMLIVGDMKRDLIQPCDSPEMGSSLSMQQSKNVFFPSQL